MHVTNINTGWPTDTPSTSPPSPPSGPMTRARVKALHDKVNSLLITLDLDTPLDGMLLTSDTLCVIRYIPQEPWLKIQEKGLLPRQEAEDAGRRAVLPLGGSGTTACNGTAAPEEAVLPLWR